MGATRTVFSTSPTFLGIVLTLSLLRRSTTVTISLLTTALKRVDTAKHNLFVFYLSRVGSLYCHDRRRLNYTNIWLPIDHERRYP